MPPSDFPVEPIVVTDASEEALARWRSDVGPLRVVEVDGTEAPTEAELFDRLAKAFDAPGHFGHNWDAVHDVLVDLSWLDADGYVLIVDRATQLLSGEEPERFAIFCAVMSSVADQWAEGGGTGERRRLVFRTVLRAEPGQLDELAGRVGESADVAVLAL